ncbi:MAG: branched-chain amino acid transport system permease protein, partial [Baekduia sp.]|nr:branched-chain amino acid transport system permease protein [Baekduia sp.]
MTAFLQLLFQGLALGCIYALVALGFTVVYRASKVINFAQGSL